MKVTNVCINGIKNPIGYQYDGICCSWNVEETKSTRQEGAKIEVSTDRDFTNIIYTKQGRDLTQSGEMLELPLTPRTTYYYRVNVWGNCGDVAVSEVMTFETGKMSECWAAEWISAQQEDSFHPILRKQFKIEKKVVRARFYGTGVGLFEVRLNGKKVGDEFLMPYVTDYEQGIQIMTLVLDEQIKEENTFEIFLGKGWYMGAFGLENKTENYGSRMAAIGEIHLEYEDGSSELIMTDASWQYRGSDIEESGIYEGEVINRLLWEEQENAWKAVEVIADANQDKGTDNLVKAHLKDRLSLPVLIKEEIPVKEIIMTPAGETVLDMGQNFAGWISFVARLPKGTKVTLDFGEILQGGNFYNKNYRDAKAQFVYISDGREEIVRPHFTFFGFRYVRVSGWVGELKKEDFTGNVVYSDVRRVGYIVTGHSKLNRLYENTVWGEKSNFLDMPTDCPQRSERLGWTGDAQVFAPTASYHMDTRAFFHKFISDLRTEQKLLHGGMPNYLPNFGHREAAGSVWGDIATLLPETLYRFYGNQQEMEQNYPLMKEWVDYIDQTDCARGATYLFDFGDTFGDWLALDGATPTSFKGSTDDVYISTVYYYRSVQIVRKAAESLGKHEDAEHYAQLEQNIFAAVLREFFTPSGRLAIDTQAAYVIALKFGVYTDREKLIAQFRQRLQKDCNQIKCGFVGAPMLCTVLAEAGLYELAYDFLLKEGFPSWLYSVNLGATTIWERWNSVAEDGTISNTGMNSLNHYAYGSVMEFVYAYAAGIREACPGYRKAVIEPHPDIRISRLACTYESVCGRYVCNWEIQSDGTFTMHVEIPFNATALVTLPESGEEPMELAAGSYDFSYKPIRDFRKPYHRQTTLERIAQNEQALAILFEHVPAIGGIAASHDPEMGAKTLEQIMKMPYLPFESEKLQEAMAQLRELVVMPQV